MDVVRKGPDTIPIDSTGVKWGIRVFRAIDELITNLKKIIVDVWAGAPDASDAIVRVGVYCFDCGTYLGYTEYAGDSGWKSFEVDGNVIREHKDHGIYLRIEVTQASATSGAQQEFTDRLLYYIYDFT